MPKSDPVVYTPMSHNVIHFGSPIGSQFTKPKPSEEAEQEKEAK